MLKLSCITKRRMTVNKFLDDFFVNEKIEYYGVLPIEECILTRDYLLKKQNFTPKSVICFAVPYYTQEGKNISKYAISQDYHMYMTDLSCKLCECIQKNFDDSICFGFCDHSPVSEVLLAAKCGIGVVGKNGLLITEKYSSFVFIGEVFTDIDAKTLGYSAAEEVAECCKCGACQRHCPTHLLAGSGSECLSEITQKRGYLDFEQQKLIIENGCAWGCDICQDVCPYTKNAKKNNTLVTPIQYFHTNQITELDCSIIDKMDEKEFNGRAYAWRKRETIKRNLEILKKAEYEKLQRTVEGK